MSMHVSGRVCSAFKSCSLLDTMEQLRSCKRLDTFQKRVGMSPASCRTCRSSLTRGWSCHAVDRQCMTLHARRAGEVKAGGAAHRGSLQARCQLWRNRSNPRTGWPRTPEGAAAHCTTRCACSASKAVRAPGLAEVSTDIAEVVLELVSAPVLCGHSVLTNYMSLPVGSVGTYLQTLIQYRRSNVGRREACLTWQYARKP